MGNLFQKEDPIKIDFSSQFWQDLRRKDEERKREDEARREREINEEYRIRIKQAEEEYLREHTRITGTMSCELCDKVLFSYVAYKEKGMFSSINKYQIEGSDTWRWDHPVNNDVIYQLKKGYSSATVCKACYFKYKEPNRY